MASPFVPSPDLSSFYAGRMAPPIKLPNGTYIPAPNVMSVEEMYRGIYPPAPSTPLVSHSVNTLPIDANGNPVMPQQPSFQTGMLGRMSPPSVPGPPQSGVRPALTAGVQPAGTVTMPSGVRPASIGYPPPPGPPQQMAQAGMFGRGNGGYWSGALKDQSQLPANDGGEAGFLQAFGPDAASGPALAAIDQAAGFPPLPRQRPIPPARIPLTSITGGVPSIPGPITFKRGDTVSALAKKLGMTTSSFADLYGIANPNRIRAGDTVAPLPPTMPRMPSAGLRSPQRAQSSRSSRSGETADQRLSRQKAEDQSSFYDENGFFKWSS